MRLITVSETTKGENIHKAALQLLSELDSDKAKIMSVATEGAPSMFGSNTEFVTSGIQCYHSTPSDISKHSGQNGQKTFEQDMAAVTKIANFVVSGAIDSGQFKMFLDEVSSQHCGLNDPQSC